MFIKNIEQQNFSLDNFEGPLDFLLYLIQKNEIDIYNIPLTKITDQYKKYLENLQELCVESGAEFVGLTASLLWIKSKMLLPKHDSEETVEGEEGLDPEFAIIHHLLDYCRFKEVAKNFGEREQRQAGLYTRGIDPSFEVTRQFLGVEHLTLEDLSGVFQQILQKSVGSRGVIQGEAWQVSDKMKLIKGLLLEAMPVHLNQLFNAEQCREEIIVTFLAILEMMKLGEIKVVKETSSQSIMIIV